MFLSVSLPFCETELTDRTGEGPCDFARTSLPETGDDFAVLGEDGLPCPLDSLSGIVDPYLMCILFTVADKHKQEAADLASRFHEVGFRIWATEGTAKFFEEKGIPCKIGYKIGEESVNLIDLIQKGKVQYVVNTMTKGKQSERDGFQIRRMSVENGVPCLTSMDTVEAILKVIESMSFKMETM